MPKRYLGYQVGRLRYNPSKGFSYIKVWMSTPGKPLNAAIRGPFASVEACRVDLRSIS